MIVWVNSEAEYRAGAGSIMGCPRVKLKTNFKETRKLQDVPDRFYFGFPVKPYSRSRGVS